MSTAQIICLVLSLRVLHVFRIFRFALFALSNQTLIDRCNFLADLTQVFSRIRYSSVS